MNRTLGRGNLLARATEGMRLAVDALRASKTRAALTILGIAIGVMVVVGMASMITGIRNSVTDIVEQAGPKTFIVLRYFQAGIVVSDDRMAPWRHRPPLTEADAKLIGSLSDVAAINVHEAANSEVAYRDKRLSSVGIDGYSATWMQVSGGELLEGRNFTPTEADGGAFVAVINDQGVKQLMPGLDPIGKQIRIFGLPFTIIGEYRDPKGVFGNNTAVRIVVPHQTLVHHADYQRNWMDIAVFPAANASQADAMDQVTSALRVKRGLKPEQDNNFDLVSGDKFLESFNSITSGFFLVMLVLSSVGLMVGGVGVVAIMMISVTERTREIGVRKALGATRGEILFQFLIEAATLTVIGGLFGLAAGAVIAFGIEHLTPIPAVVPLWSVFAAILTSAVTGIFFGLYPANRAARLDPVDALRYE